MDVQLQLQGAESAKQATESAKLHAENTNQEVMPALEEARLISRVWVPIRVWVQVMVSVWVRFKLRLLDFRVRVSVRVRPLAFEARVQPAVMGRSILYLYMPWLPP